MANITNLQSFLRDVANAIKNKNGSTTNIRAENFDIEINNIQTGTITEDEYAEMLTISQNILGGQEDPEDDTDTTHLQRPAEYLHSFYPINSSQPCEGFSISDIHLNTNNVEVTNMLENFMPDITGDEKFVLSFEYRDEDTYMNNWSIYLNITETERYISISDPTSRDMMMGDGFNNLYYYTKSKYMTTPGKALNTWIRLISDYEDSYFEDMSEEVSGIDYSSLGKAFYTVTVYMVPDTMKTVENIKAALSMIEKILGTTFLLDENMEIPEESDGTITLNVNPYNAISTGSIAQAEDEVWWLVSANDPETKYYIVNELVTVPEGEYYLRTDNVRTHAVTDRRYIRLSAGRNQYLNQEMIKAEDAVKVTFDIQHANPNWKPQELMTKFVGINPENNYNEHYHPILDELRQCYVPRYLYTIITLQVYDYMVTNKDELANIDLSNLDEATVTIKMA